MREDVPAGDLSSLVVIVLLAFVAAFVDVFIVGFIVAFVVASFFTASSLMLSWDSAVVLFSTRSREPGIGWTGGAAMCVRRH